MILRMIPMSRTQNCVKKHHSPTGILRTQHFKSHQITRHTRQEETSVLRFFVTSVPQRPHENDAYKHKEPGAGVWLGGRALDWHARGPGSTPSVANGIFLFAFSPIYIPGNHVKSITLL